MHPSGQRTSAPWISIPDGNITAVEHPCHIKHDVEKAIAMLGGSAAISQALSIDSEKTFALSFRPDDPTTRTIVANRKSANNILLQISVPKRTGRKRKRGTTEPWIEADESETSKRDAAKLVRAMQDNPQTYRVTALGSIPVTHVWRSMPDFAYSTQHIQALQDVKSTILTNHYPAIKQFRMPVTHGLQDTTTLPPVIWSQVATPQPYTYRQNPSVRVVNDPSTGQVSLHNTQAPPKIYSYQMQWNDPEYPKSPDPRLAPLTEQSKFFQETTKALEKLFEGRPILTRRALLNLLQSELSSFNVVRFCLAYVAYAMRSGPWRDTYIRLGVDPRTDNSYRVYQTIMLQLVPKETTTLKAALYRNHSSRNKTKETGGDEAQNAGHDPEAAAAATATIAETKRIAENRKTYSRFWARSNDITSHIFDGVTRLPSDGKIWQLCDMTDPQLSRLRDLPVDQLRPTCEPRYFGWYMNGTSAKLRIVLRAKVDALQRGTVMDTSMLETFLALPDNVHVLSEPSKELTNDQDLSVTSSGNNNQSSSMQVSTDAARAPTAADSETQQQGLRDTSREISANRSLSIHKTYNAPVICDHETLVDWIGRPPSKDQLTWLGLYRAYSRTEPGKTPASSGFNSVPKVGGSIRPNMGRLSRQTPRAQKTGTVAAQYSTRTVSARGSTRSQATARDTEPPTEIGQSQTSTEAAAQDMPSDRDEEDEMIDVTPVAQAGEDVLPSIEFNGFDDEEGDDSELGLDIDPEIKIEPDDGDVLGMFDYVS